MTRYFGAHTLEGEWHSLLPRYVLLSDRVDGKQILDIGCGTGIGSSMLLGMGADGVNGIDHRPEVLELARVKHAKQGLSFQVMLWEELEFPDDAFDMVLCLDPTSPVTDPSLLAEVERVLRPGGEYVCAIERRNVEGMESLLPRYGYDTNGEELELSKPGERVPQIGALEESFETIVSLVQRPRYSYVFDYARDDEHSVRRSSAGPDESGLWVGDQPHPDGDTQHTDNRAGRWLSVDDRLADRADTSAAVELLFCGDDHMPPPTLREVEMPYREVVDRLQQLFSELQLRQHPDETTQPDAGAVDSSNFKTREKTSEFRAPDNRSGQQPQRRPRRHQDHSPSRRRPDAPSRDTEGQTWHQVRQQLDRMTQMYREVRADMEDLFVETRRELAERDRYIEQLVDTVHSWRHELQNADDPTAGDDTYGGDETDSTPEFERQPTNIFERDAILDDSSSDELHESDDGPEQSPGDAHDGDGETTKTDSDDDSRAAADDADDESSDQAGDENDRTDRNAEGENSGDDSSAGDDSNAEGSRPDSEASSET